jgi:hypothetical protein
MCIIKTMIVKELRYFAELEHQMFFLSKRL